MNEPKSIHNGSQASKEFCDEKQLRVAVSSSVSFSVLYQDAHA